MKLCLRLQKSTVLHQFQISINASLAKPGRTRHILSFLSQFYIEEKDEILLPKSVTVYHENIPYWIYFSTRCELNHLIS